MGLKTLIRHFREMPNYFIASTLVFLAGIVLGYGYSEHFQAVLQSRVEGLRELARTIGEKDHSYWWLFGFIFLNNTLNSVLVMFSGILFGVLPIGFLVLNGMILGYLSAGFVEANQTWVLVKGILPHGIVEIPAVIVACAYGIKFGSIMAKGVFRLASPTGRSAFAAELERFLKLTVPLIGLLVVALLVAAFIESTITPWLIGL